MVIGLGTDLIEIERIAHSVERYGEAFLQRVFTAGEIEYCQRKKKNSAESLAARFAAKEAGAKALGTGISRGVSWLEFEVRQASGAEAGAVSERTRGRGREGPGNPESIAQPGAFAGIFDCGGGRGRLGGGSGRGQERYGSGRAAS